MSFLTAQWRKLAIANYEVESEFLQKYVPTGTDLDLWEDKAYLSLVGFRFVDTKLKGMKIPFHVNFEEVNLRFYVKRKAGGEWRRGVVFIREIVPRHAITLVANTIYKENYKTFPMRHELTEEASSQSVKYSWKAGGKWQHFSVEAQKEPTKIDPGCKTEFITEHYWGYARISKNQTNEYEVIHPRWKKYDILNHDISIDFGQTYGPEFNFLNKKSPSSIMLAEGSEISVEPKKTLTY